MYKKLFLFSLLFLTIFMVTACQSPKKVNYTIEETDEISMGQNKGLWSSEEYQWIQANRNRYLIFACAKDYIPLEYLSDGEPHGIGVNVLSQVSKATGLKFKLYENNPNEEWHQLINSFKNKEIDILTTVSYSDERTWFLDFTEPYMYSTLVIIGHEDNNYYLNLSSVYLKNRTFVIPKGYWLNEYLVNKTAGNIDIHPVNNTQEAFDAINTKKADYTVSEISLFTYYRNLAPYKHLRIVGEIAQKNAIMMGVQKESPLITSIINKVIMNIDKGQLYETSLVMPSRNLNKQLLFTIFLLALIILIIGYLLFKNYHQLLTTKKQLEINIKQKEKFMEDISHDLKTPLMITIGYIDTITDGEIQNKDSIQKYLRKVQSTALYMQLLVNDLFLLAKHENHLIKYKKEYTSINNLIEEVVSVIRISTDEKSIFLCMEIESTKQTLLKLDSFRIRQALTNILYNAVKFTSKDGKIIIATKLLDHNNVLISIKDSGYGIPQEDLPYVFDRYYRSKNNRDSHSTGLGLCIAKHIILHHGGKIWADSLPDQGSVFYIEI